MSKEELYFKLNKIYEGIINIEFKLEKQELEKRKKEVKESKELAEIELREVEYQLNNYWNFRDDKQREFNVDFGDIEKVE